MAGNNIRRVPRRSSLSDLQHEINQLFDFEWPGNARSFLSQFREAEWVPAVNVKERKNDYWISAELPGIDKKDVEITINNNILTIQGQREEYKEEKDEKFLRVESSSGSFMRQISLPENVDSGKSMAKFQDGILEIILPKTSKSGAKTVEIKS